MKIIDVEEAKAHLEDYARECQSSPVVVTLKGTPIFEMLPIRPDDSEFIDSLLEKNEAFRRLMEQRKAEAQRGETSTLDEVRARLANTREPL
jgi:antitoxin (DNA-binding transcriptional repressor) of toxin-antitoxin stability system